MGIMEIFSIIGQAVGIIKPLVDKKEQAKAATGEAMKESAATPSPSLANQDEMDYLKADLQKDIDQEKETNKPSP